MTISCTNNLLKCTVLFLYLWLWVCIRNWYGIIGVFLAELVHYWLPNRILLNAVHEVLQQDYLTEGQWLFTKIVTQSRKADVGVEQDLWSKDSARCYDKCVSLNTVVFFLKKVSHHGILNFLSAFSRASVMEFPALPHFLMNLEICLRFYYWNGLT